MSIFGYLIEYNRYLNIVGIGVILLIAALFSKNRKKISLAFIGKALLLQFAIAFLVLKTTFGQKAVQALAYGAQKMYQFADVGSAFVFGNLMQADGPWGFVFAIKVLPVIIFFGAVTGLLFHWGIIQVVVKGVNAVIRPVLGTTGPETLCATANSVLGQTEAPLLIRRYLKHMTKSEMLVVMVSGMATISGSILVVFAAMGVPAAHMLAASVMAIPASILIAKILLPETDVQHVKDSTEPDERDNAQNSLGAIAVGTSDGLNLAVNVAAMLIAFLALLALLNHLLSFGAFEINKLLTKLSFDVQLPQPLSIELIFSYLFAPFGYLLGFTDGQALAAGQLIGTKVAVNELIAFSQMVKMNLSERAVTILTYALCGFSNFSCIGIQLGGIGALVPERRAWLSELGLYAVLGGALSNLLSAMIAALLL